MMFVLLYETGPDQGVPLGTPIGVTASRELAIAHATSTMRDMVGSAVESHGDAEVVIAPDAAVEQSVRIRILSVRALS